MAKHIGRQVSLFRAWVPVAGVLLLIGFVPGMPNLLFLFAAAAAGLTAYFLRNFTPEDDETAPSAKGTTAMGGGQSQGGPDEDGSEPTSPDQIGLSDVTDNSPVSIPLGYGLIEMVDEETGGPLVNRITGVRKQISRNLGCLLYTSPSPRDQRGSRMPSSA